MRSRAVFLMVVGGLVVASCGGGESTETTPADVATTSSPSATAPEATTAETAPFHAIPDDSVRVTGTATCEFSQEGVDPTGGDNNDFVTCELDMSDPRVSGTETHDRFRYFYVEGDEAGMWVVEEAIITNSEGTWRGTAQAVDDGTPMGEARYVGERAYNGLIFHYYFADVRVGEAQVHGWISSGE
jgi:hypothetical protein